MPILCPKCMDRTVGSFVSIEGYLVQYCKCHRLWDRTNGTPIQTAVYYTGGEKFRLNSGDGSPKKVN